MSIVSLMRHNPVASYTHWLHTMWPAGKPEKLPLVNADGTTNVSGLYVVGDLTGVPLLKLSANAGTRVVREIANDLGADRAGDGELDVAIIGGGTSGFAAALEAEKLGLKYLVFEASEPYATIVNFPKGKPIYKYPTDMPLEGDLEFHDKSDVKEGLIDDLREQTVDKGVKWAKARVEGVKGGKGRFQLDIPGGVEAPQGVSLNGTGFVVGQKTVKAKRVVVGIGRSGNYRKLGVLGEELPKVYNRLHDPADYCGQDVLIVGGGDSAMEAAIALAECGANVTLSYRKAEFNRPKPENIEKIETLAADPNARADVEESSDPRTVPSLGESATRAAKRGQLKLMMASNVSAIREGEVDLKDADGQTQTLKNDSVFAMLGREAPLDFFRRSGVPIIGELTPRTILWPAFFFLICLWVYSWKDFVPYLGQLPAWLSPEPSKLTDWMMSWGGTIGGWINDPSTLVGTIAISMSKRSFYYTVAYSVLVVVFGIRRIRRRRTPYVKVQTLTLMSIQVVPLFLLPVIVLPWLGHNGVFDAGFGRWLGDVFFPESPWSEHGREYWRAFGLILAWPLMVWNWFTAEPLWGWLILGFLQTFVAIPFLVYFWGKGAYCGWICSCGAMAETLGDTQRHKMPHGPFWNRLNMVGQVVLWIALLMMAIRIVGWSLPDGNFAERLFRWMHVGGVSGALGGPNGALSYWWTVDLLFAAILGYGLYYFMSGRVWCRFACPLAALMHIYARVGRFAILADKKKCISCNVCTSVCHQGIDIMSFANKGKPMKDPECVRCSACVQMCPTGVLTFGQTDRAGNTLSTDPAWLAASPVQMVESARMTVNGKAQSHG
ncbi:MAG: NAD(P)-binding domain-containing protein [Planctomycetota bacterium]